jgi:hypothetical protein
MSAEIRVCNMRQRIAEGPNDLVVNTCSNSKESWSSDFSPFLLGPTKLYGEFRSLTHENAWQYSKLYADYADSTGRPKQEYWDWARAGWNNPKAVRFPKGRGARPLYSWWDGEKLPYVEARKKIYAPLYKGLVTKTDGYKKLLQLREEVKGKIWLRDFDGYDEVEKGMTLTEVLNLPTRKMGHAFVLKMIATDDPALKQLRQI